MVRLGVSDPGAELGVARIKLADLARLYRVASDASVVNPDDDVLASAVRKLRDGVLPGFRLVEAEPWARLDELRRAIGERRKIKITYARAWAPVIEEGVVEPYGVLRTHRGWELDAAPGDDLSPLRTFLLFNVRSLEVLSETFEMPADVTAMITKHRTKQIVIMDVPHHARWAVDTHAERVELINDGPELARLQVTVLQPYRLRVGLMLVVGGPSARVVEPAELRDAGAEVARGMLQRYEETR